MAEVGIVGRSPSPAATAQLRRRHARPLTAVQERLFLGLAFGTAVLVQLAVVWMPLLAAH